MMLLLYRSAGLSLLSLLLVVLSCCWCLMTSVDSFSLVPPLANPVHHYGGPCRPKLATAAAAAAAAAHNEGVNNDNDDDGSSATTTTATTTITTRRHWMRTALTATTAAAAASVTANPFLAAAWAEDTTTTATTTTEGNNDSMYSPKFVQSYQDFVETPQGWSYRDVNPGKQDYLSQVGDRVVYDWSGYTIGYFGRPFQAKGGPQGGAFDKDIDYNRVVLGSGKVVKGLEQALTGMSTGGVRQVLIPYGDLSYPPTDPDHELVGPKPSTFSGMRALNFVLENPRVDRTLLFNVKVIRIDRPDGKGTFKRG